MVVDKAGRDYPALGIDGAFGRAAQFAELDDLAVFDTDIAAKGRHSGPVNDAAVSNQQVICHRFPFLASGCALWSHQDFSTQHVLQRQFVASWLICASSTAAFDGMAFGAPTQH